MILKESFYKIRQYEPYSVVLFLFLFVCLTCCLLSNTDQHINKQKRFQQTTLRVFHKLPWSLWEPVWTLEERQTQYYDFFFFFFCPFSLKLSVVFNLSFSTFIFCTFYCLDRNLFMMYFSPILNLGAHVDWLWVCWGH